MYYFLIKTAPIPETQRGIHQKQTQNHSIHKNKDKTREQFSTTHDHYMTSILNTLKKAVPQYRECTIYLPKKKKNPSWIRENPRGGDTSKVNCKCLLHTIILVRILARLSEWDTGEFMSRSSFFKKTEIEIVNSSYFLLRFNLQLLHFPNPKMALGEQNLPHKGAAFAVFIALYPTFHHSPYQNWAKAYLGT